MPRGLHQIVTATAVAALLALGALAQSAQAGPVNFELRISEVAELTANPGNVPLSAQAANATQHELLAARDMPYMQLMNTSPPGNDQIVRFSITIGDLFNNQHHFDWVRVVDFSPGITWAFVMPDGDNGGVRSDAIDVFFTGFTPGKLIRFQTDIDNDGGNTDMFTDYRTVLFDMNGNNATDNSLVTVQFQQSPGLPLAVASDFLPDYPFLEATNIGIQFGPCGPDAVKTFSAAGSAFVIPEPGSLALTLMGFAAVAFGCVINRRKK
jgi:PEP-CTERM motif